MADRVNPCDLPPDSSESQMTSSQWAAFAPKAPQLPPSAKPVPLPETYVIQMPKAMDLFHRVPPPENARRHDQYTRRKQRQSRCCCCFCWLIGLIFVLIVLLGIAAGVLYLVFLPKATNYTIHSIAIRGINVTSLSSTEAISPEFDVTVRADNPNKKIGISYETDSPAEIFYNDVRLCNGALPAFVQPSDNVTVFETSLKGNGIELTSEDQRALLGAETKQEVPLTFRLRAPVKIKVGSVETWKITVKVDCDVTVNDLTVKAKIVSKHCNYRVNLW